VRDEIARYGEVREGPAVDAVLGRSSRSKARSSGPLRFHTDRCDVVSLLCVRPARAGGLSKVVSAVSVAEAIRARRPDLHALLFGDYWRSRQGEEDGGEQQVYALPVFAEHAGKFTTQYSRTFVEAAQKLPEVPRMSAAQDEALDLHAALCEELSFTMEFRPGDLQLLNHHVVYHARTAYEDAPGPDTTPAPAPLARATQQPCAAAGFEVLWARRRPARRAAASPSGPRDERAGRHPRHARRRRSRRARVAARRPLARRLARPTLAALPRRAGCRRASGAARPAAAARAHARASSRSTRAPR